LLGASAGLAVYRSPIQMLADAIVNGIVSQAYAQEMGMNPRRYVYLQQAGAPIRWNFDCFLNPYPQLNEAAFVPNKSVATRFQSQNGRYTSAEHASWTF